MEEERGEIYSLSLSPIKYPSIQGRTRNRTMVFHGTAACQIKLYYDCTISIVAAKDAANGNPGYVQPVMPYTSKYRYSNVKVVVCTNILLLIFC